MIGQPAQSCRYDHRLAGIQIRNFLRPLLDGDVCRPVYVHIFQRRFFQSRQQRGHFFAYVADVVDIGVRAASEARGFFHEPRVGRRTDADREQAAVAEFFFDLGEQLRFIANRAIGNKHDLAQVTGVVPRTESDLERRRHVGAAIGS